jgi:uracil-DNA glycosylase
MKAIEKQVGDWYPLLKPLLETEDFKKITSTIKQCKSHGFKVLPDTKLTFKAFNKCQYKDVKVVILGQDPYHDGSATGLAFANDPNSYASTSPSLRNIITAVEKDFATLSMDFDISLENWAEQGVLLLNTALTVLKGNAGSHTKVWRPFTEKFLESLSSSKDNLIFVLWGKKAQEYEKFIKGDNKVLKAAHPAAESYSGGRAGFFTCGHFSEVNRILSNPIYWCPSCDPEYFPKTLDEAPF